MTFVVATHNAHKLAELQAILSTLGIQAITADLPDVEETGITFAENARLKAQAACEATGLPAIGDDSGLCVDELGSDPGVYSARYAGEGASAAACNAKLLQELADIPPEYRTAGFVCAICCVFPDGTCLETIGSCQGFIALEPQGEGGFGYDPLFLTADGRSFAQLSGDEKDAISHRGRALTQLKTLLEERYANTHE